MARDEVGRSIWDSDNFVRLRVAEKLLYFTISETTDRAGIGDITPNRFATLINCDPGDIVEWLRGLAVADLVVIDESTDELLLQDAMRLGRIDKMPNQLRNIGGLAERILSPHIRERLATELEKFDRQDARRAASDIRAGIVRRSRVRHRPSIPAATRSAVYERDEWRCVYCGHEFAPAAPGMAPEDQAAAVWLELDHKEPYSMGGADTVDNLRAACSTCNRRRGVTDADLWAQEHGTEGDA